MVCPRTVGLRIVGEWEWDDWPSAHNCCFCPLAVPRFAAPSPMCCLHVHIPSASHSGWSNGMQWGKGGRGLQQRKYASSRKRARLPLGARRRRRRRFIPYQPFPTQ